MSNIESLDRLKEFVSEDALLTEMVEAVEHEFLERLVEPCDADGVPIKPGDALSFNGIKAKCAAVSKERIYYWDDHGFWSWANANKCYHVKPRTLEDVLRDAIGEYECAPMDDSDAVQRIAAKYADEIRELMGVSE